MIQGTTSSAGKSTLTYALARYFSDHNIEVFPFKSQNMGSNTIEVEDGGLISSAQYIQAVAARSKPSVYNNPLLLMPKNHMDSDVYFLGKAVKELSAKDFTNYKKVYKEKIKEVYEEIKAKHDFVLIEGAGSPAEINLNENDFVNMGMADIADAKVILVTDVDRGGSFASLYGTVMLLPESQRKRIIGFVFNKFRGDVKLLETGFPTLEKLTGIPVLGTMPYMELNFAEEDSLGDPKKMDLALDRNFLEADLNKLASVLDSHLDMERIMEAIKE